MLRFGFLIYLCLLSLTPSAVLAIEWIQASQSGACSLDPSIGAITIGIDLIAQATAQPETPACFVIRRSSTAYGHFRYTGTDQLTLFHNCDSTCQNNCTVFRVLYRQGSPFGSPCDARYRVLSNITSVSTLDNLRPMAIGDDPGQTRTWINSAFYKTTDCSDNISYVEIFSNFGTCKAINGTTYVQTDALLGYYVTSTCSSPSCSVSNCTLRVSTNVPEVTPKCTNGSITVTGNPNASGWLFNSAATTTTNSTNPNSNNNSSTSDNNSALSSGASSNPLGIGGIVGICIAVVVIATAVAYFLYKRSHVDDTNVSGASLFTKKKQNIDPPSIPPKIVVAQAAQDSTATLAAPAVESSVSPLMAATSSSLQVNQADSTRASSPPPQIQPQPGNRLELSDNARSSVISVVPSMSGMNMAADPHASMYQPYGTDTAHMSAYSGYTSHMSFMPMTTGATMMGMMTPEGYIVPVMMPTGSSSNIEPSNVNMMHMNTPDSNGLPPAYEEVASETHSSNAQQQAGNVDLKVPIPTLQEVNRQLSQLSTSSIMQNEASSPQEQPDTSTSPMSETPETHLDKS